MVCSVTNRRFWLNISWVESFTFDIYKTYLFCFLSSSPRCVCTWIVHVCYVHSVWCGSIEQAWPIYVWNFSDLKVFSENEEYEEKGGVHSNKLLKLSWWIQGIHYLEGSKTNKLSPIFISWSDFKREEWCRFCGGEKKGKTKNRKLVFWNHQKLKPSKSR